MVNKGSNSADFVRFRPHIYACTQQSLPPLWAAIINDYTNAIKVYEDYINFKIEQAENRKSIEKKLVFQINR